MKPEVERRFPDDRRMKPEVERRFEDDRGMKPEVHRLVQERAGVVARAELLGLGLSEREIWQQTRAGVWRTAGRRILVHSSTPDGPVAATLIVARGLPDAIVTGPSAALLNPHPAWARLRPAGLLPMLISADGDRALCRTVRHPGAQHGQHPAGVEVADHHTTAVDLIRFLPWADAAAVAARAIALRATTVAALEASIDVLGSTEGVWQLRRITAALARGAESGPEVDLHIALHRANIRRWVANPTLQLADTIFRPDILFPAERVTIEYDGLAEHTGAAVFTADRVRANRFAFAGYVMLRLTSATLYDERAWADFIGDLRVLLHRRRPARRRGSGSSAGRAPA